MSPNIRLAEELKDSDVRIIAILKEKPKDEFPGIDLYIADAPVEELQTGGLDIVWFADKAGNVVHLNRSDIYSSAQNERVVAETLDSAE